MEERKSKNGCVVKYSETPVKLSDELSVYFKIEEVFQPQGVEDEEMEELLKSVEDEINTNLLAFFNVGNMDGVYPLFYLKYPQIPQIGIVLKTFLGNFSYIEGAKIYLYPSNESLAFQGSWNDYKDFKSGRGEKVLVINSDNTEDNGSMIGYWIDNTHYNFDNNDYVCPATRALVKKENLDGAHVEIVGHREMGRFIIPVLNSFNRSHSKKPFFVNPENLVVAP